MKPKLFHVEQHSPLIFSFLAGGSLREWSDRLLGPDVPIWALCLFLLFFLAMLGLGLIVLAIVFNTFKGSWDLFRFLHSTRDKSLPCTNCGYDLRHKPDRCPECGQRIWFKDRPKRPPPTPPPVDARSEGTSATRHPE